MNTHLKLFKDCFLKLSYRESYASVFGDFLEYTLLMLNINKKDSDFAELEKKWKQPEEHKLFFEMFTHWGNSMDSFDDSLGDLFMECVSHGRNGQFFTPEPICDMMAQISNTNNLKDGDSVQDPACGSGRMLLSIARINRNLLFFGSDTDINCVKMTAINMIVNSMVGEVAHMNTLSLEHWGSYYIKRFRSGTHYLPYFYKTPAGETHIFKKMKVTEESKDKEVINNSTVAGRQMNLF